MFFRVLSLLVAVGVIALIVTPDAPESLRWMVWVYLFVMCGVGMLAMNAPRIHQWWLTKEAELKSRFKR
ncbi:hypothetical protein LRP50_20305 [Enterovibrio sp. ZSDZ42]|uniref:Uncharacterized protein n=1 Tax=Enterovibrio gelatinilyticus TaxID=2899819 RepID=A0ABT5R7I3_9GAMM|nr:hypothetical protein [Enterovibrio sp. ZSDZ42]MDD1795477.1 hypothetical protein [Enterovibrio sp. ZSDZ42]